MTFDYYDSPLGLIEIEVNGHAVSRISFVKEMQNRVVGNSLALEAKEQLRKYFSSELQSFDLPLDLSTGTPFYQKVWNELLKIPYGTTVSYLEISRRLGDHKLTRAVGMANARNPIAIVVPCHRVIGQNGSLTGYAHGIEVKQQLLSIENPKEYALNGTLF